MRQLSQPQRRHLLAGAAALGAAAALHPGAVVAAAAPRIVSVGGAITETLFALGAQANLVGVDTTSYFPEAAKQLPVVGYQRTLSAEGVLSLSPTLLLATEDAGPATVLRQIAAAHVPIHLLDAGHSIDGVIARTQRLADLSGRSDAGAALLAQLRAQWTLTSQRVAALQPADPGQRPRVLFLMAHSIHQMRVAGQRTGADTLIAYAGGRNACTGFDGYRALTPEAAVAAAPDVIVTTDLTLAAVGGVSGLLQTPGLAQTPAARTQRVIGVEILLSLGFGPRLPLAVSTLAEALYGARAGKT